jgi:hypothetical protein
MYYSIAMDLIHALSYIHIKYTEHFSKSETVRGEKGRKKKIKQCQSEY